MLKLDGNFTAPEASEQKANVRPQKYPKPYGWRPPQYRIIVKKDPNEMPPEDWAATYSGFIQALADNDEGQRIELYDYQDEHMENDCEFRHIDKTRQAGISWIFSAESVAKNYLKNRQTSIFVSYNHKEAMNKIRYAKELHDSIPAEYQKTLIVDNKQSLEFEHNGKRTRIISIAARQPRGEGNNTDVYLDEYAHMMYPDAIYTAAVPIITRGTGCLTIASTPLGKNSKHYEIGNDRGNYYMFSRMKIFWWDCPAMCVDVEDARKHAPSMRTEERVEKYGTRKFKLLFGSMDIDDFMQEYEIYYIDSSVSYFPLELIQTCVFNDENSSSMILESNINPEEVPVAWAPIENGDSLYVPDTIMNHYKDEGINWFFDKLSIKSDNDNAIEQASDLAGRMKIHMHAGEFGRNLLLGMDIGRKKDTSEISIVEQIEVGKLNLHVERLSIELEDIKFRVQEKIVETLIKILGISKARIDKTGIGANIAEDLEDIFPGVVEGIEFNLETKEEMAKNFRFRLEDRTIAIYDDPDAIKQIHSIKRKVTEASKIKFNPEGTKKHHGDKFWAKALASIGGDDYDRQKVVKSSLQKSGQRLFVANAKTPNIMKKIANRVSRPNYSTNAPRANFMTSNSGPMPFANVFFDDKFYGR